MRRVGRIQSPRKPSAVEFVYKLIRTGRLLTFKVQLRPMTARADLNWITTEADRVRACLSSHALANAEKRDVRDIVPRAARNIRRAKTVEIAQEIGRINARLAAEGRKYLLAGPGRWARPTGGRDLVAWNDICGVAAIVETRVPQLRWSVPGLPFLSQYHHPGHQLRHNRASQERFDWDWLVAQDLVVRDEHASTSVCPGPWSSRSTARSSCCAMLMDDGSEAGECARTPRRAWSQIAALRTRPAGREAASPSAPRLRRCVGRALQTQHW